MIEGGGEVEPEDLTQREARWLAAEFREALEPEDRGLVERCMIDGESQSQAGEALGMSRDQVYRNLQRIKRCVHRFFKGRGWFDEP